MSAVSENNPLEPGAEKPRHDPGGFAQV